MDDSTGEVITSPGQDEEQPDPVPKHRHFDRWLMVGVPVAIALASFLLSLYTWYENSRPPEVDLSLPGVVRVTQGEEQAWLYLQPRFVSTSSNDRIDVITTIEVRVTGLESGESVNFVWDEHGSWVFNHDTRSLRWDWVADPGPLVVSPANPQMPTGLFMAEDGWVWQPGEYEVVVTSERSADKETLVQSGFLTLTQEQIGRLEEGRGSLFLEIELRFDAL